MEDKFHDTENIPANTVLLIPMVAIMDKPSESPSDIIWNSLTSVGVFKKWQSNFYSFDAGTIAFAKIEEILELFNRKLDSIRQIEATFYNIREVQNRPPDFVVDIWIVIPESNREVEYLIYNKIGSFLREFDEFLFDFHIIRRKGRDLKEIIPMGYQQIK